MSSSSNQIAQTYVALVKEQKHLELIESLYSDDAVSIEPFARPGAGRTTEGKAAILGKSQAFDAVFKVESQKISDPWPHGDDKFAVHMTFEMTHIESGNTRSMDEIAVMTIRDGKISSEEFFYSE